MTRIRKQPQSLCLQGARTAAIVSLTISKLCSKESLREVVFLEVFLGSLRLWRCAKVQVFLVRYRIVCNINITSRLAPQSEGQRSEWCTNTHMFCQLCLNPMIKLQMASIKNIPVAFITFNSLVFYRAYKRNLVTFAA